MEWVRESSQLATVLTLFHYSNDQCGCTVSISWIASLPLPFLPMMSAQLASNFLEINYSATNLLVHVPLWTLRYCPQYRRQARNCSVTCVPICNFHVWSHMALQNSGASPHFHQHSMCPPSPSLRHSPTSPPRLTLPSSLIFTSLVGMKGQLPAVWIDICLISDSQWPWAFVWCSKLWWFPFLWTPLQPLSTVTLGLLSFYHWYAGVPCLRLSTCVSEVLSPNASQTTNPPSASWILSQVVRPILLLTASYSATCTLSRCVVPECPKSLNETPLRATVLSPWLNNCK